MEHTVSQEYPLKIFTLGSNDSLTKQIAEQLDGELGAIDLIRFADGEIKVTIQESIRGAHVYIVQSTSNPVNDHLMALMIAMDAFRRASAQTINLVIPYFGYGRQDREILQRAPLTAKLVANMLEMAGADHILMLDSHTNQIQGFFTQSVDYLLADALFADYFIQEKINGADLVIVCLDQGKVGRAMQFADSLRASVAMVDHREMKHNEPAVVNVMGDVRGKRIIIVDDLIDTGEMMSYTVKKLKEEGAMAIYLCGLHALLSGNAAQKLSALPIEKIIVSDSIEIPNEKRAILGSKLEIVSVATLFAEAIIRIYEHRFISPIYLKKLNESV